MNLQYFSDQDFYFSIKKFFKDLNIPVHYMTEQPAAPKDIIANTYKPKNPAHQMIDDVYFLGMVDDRAFNNQPSAIESVRLKEQDYDGLLIFGVTLDREGGKLPTRGQMAEVTRAFNREFHYTPVVIVFKYDRYICFSNCERIPYKQKWREGEKAGKVSLLMNVDTVITHPGHLQILQNLAILTSGRKAINTFEGLYNYWQEVFSVSLLSKRFYQELSNWYFWALKHVEFPDDAEKNREVRNATSVIRLITRFMFVWFLKEKRLVPDALFDKDELDQQLNYKDYHGSTYYKAILQNLFFATLNTKMKKDDPKSRKFVHRQFGIQEFYRYERFFKNKALKLFKTIPFLNGGLFENLDKNIGKLDEVRIDCFSNRPVHEKRLKVPDFLFFGAEDQIDLSDVYGSKKRKNETVRGIIHILNSYKFTIAENTPIEEEIALDPELLGKVFENLLASYNPETKTTARKQTGSFYTPREIVNYMVDESLIAYLEGRLIELYEKEAGFTQKTPPSQKKLIGKQKPVQSKITPSKSKITAKVKKEINNKFRHLLSYSTEDHLFSKKEVKTLINALDNAKILDPACGSGAFPMGILHKMVHILTKLDPQNKQWKKRQIENQSRQIKKDVSYAEKIKDNKARQKALDELEERMATINDAFDTNELDFGRKLYLIENCIFGVDIQPIAVQIAKLRFFISLIVDQLVDENKENLGIIPLPNLETKFVAANTLIGVDKKGQIGLNFQNSEINKKEKELAKVRERHFSARTPITKEKYRQKDEHLRNEIAELLKKDGFASEVTQKLAHWNPYDQNTFADFFDMEWMFGIKEGFDIVIGNPPYGVSIKGDYRKAIVSYLGKVPDYEIYYFFIEIAYALLKESGIKTFIIPNTILFNVFAAGYRLKMLTRWQIREILDCTDFDFFEKTTIRNIITRFSKNKISEYIGYKNTKDATSFMQLSDRDLLHITQDNLMLNNQNWSLAFKLDTRILNLVIKIKAEHKKLCDYFPEFSQGLIAYDKHKGQSKEIIENRVFHYKAKDKNNLKPWLWGRDVNRFIVKWNKEEYIDYCNGIANPRKPKYFKGKRILVREITNPSIYAGYTDEELYNDPAIIIILEGTKIDLLSLLAILNSTLATFYHFNSSPKATKGEFPKILVNDIKNFPLVKINTNSKKIYSSLSNLTKKILTAKKPDFSVNTVSYEAEVDACVAHLYGLTEEEYSIVLKETNFPDPFRVAAFNVYRDIARGK